MPNDDNRNDISELPTAPPVQPAPPVRSAAPVQPASVVRSAASVQPSALPGEVGGREGPEPTRFGDWELRGRCIDF
jgi:hypothetical protein